MSTMSTVGILISVVVYLVGMLAIGIVYSKNNNSEDFYLGGRKLGPIVTAMSTEASDMSAYLLMGVPGPGPFLRPGRSQLDGNRPGPGHLPQLAYRGKAAASLL